MNTLDDGKITILRESLLIWGEKSTKSYPWRETNDPYLILVAEFMLHRTQVIQALRVYNEFVAHVPSLQVFSETSLEKLKSILHPLGLGWRITAMINALSFLWENYQSVPTEANVLLEVPGIGPYISGATICFSQNKRLALVDTNTVRVTGRLFGLNLEGEARRRKDVIETICYACDPDKPRRYYYAMIDLAHSICRPNNPECSKCPLLTNRCKYGNINWRRQ